MTHTKTPSGKANESWLSVMAKGKKTELVQEEAVVDSDASALALQGLQDLFGGGSTETLSMGTVPGLISREELEGGAPTVSSGTEGVDSAVLAEIVAQAMEGASQELLESTRRIHKDLSDFSHECNARIETVRTIVTDSYAGHDKALQAVEVKVTAIETALSTLSDRVKQVVAFLQKAQETAPKASPEVSKEAPKQAAPKAAEAPTAPPVKPEKVEKEVKEPAFKVPAIVLNTILQTIPASPPQPITIVDFAKKIAAYLPKFAAGREEFVGVDEAYITKVMHLHKCVNAQGFIQPPAAK